MVTGSRYILFLLMLMAGLCLNAQVQDSSITDLSEIIIADTLHIMSGERLKDVDGVSVNATKKSEKIILSNILTDRSVNNTRQVFSRIPGFNTTENDGAGLQYGIGSRGLNPSRLANFNIRQNGYEISADALGYPESYYLPSMNAVEEIEVIRGASSLQYGPQFGGYINFRFSTPHIRPYYAFHIKNTIGMYGFYDVFADLHFARNKWGVYGFYEYKQMKGWRPNSELYQHNAYVALRYAPSSRFTLQAEYTYSGFLSHQPGGLTDLAFQNDPSQSIRSRNWLGIQWNVFALKLMYQPVHSARIELRSFGLIGQRNALGFWAPVNISDPGENRDLLSDHYRNIGAELRYLQYARIFKQTQVFLTGVRVYYGNTTRQQGTADSLSHANFNLLNPDSADQSSYHFPGLNVSAFSEMVWQFTPHFRVVPGIRFEYIQTNASGYYNEVYKDLAGNIIYQQTNTVNRSNARYFLLGGLGLSYRKKNWEVYGNFSRNYRSVTFSDIQILNPNYRVNPDLKDEKGYTSDIGFRFHPNKHLYIDAGVFYLYYADRIGTVLKTDTNTYTIYRYRTNLAESHSVGVDLLAETNVLGWFKKLKTHYALVWLVNANYTRAWYADPANTAINGNTVEYTPVFMMRTSLSLKHKTWGIAFTASYTSSQYSEATNALTSNNGNYGVIPDYFLLDVSGYWRWGAFEMNASVKNMTNQTYFTQRSEGYSGPGIIPGTPVMLTAGISYTLKK